MNDPQKPKAWVSIYDEHGEECGTLAGNKEGLSKLKEKIDEAIAKGEANTGDDLETDFQVVKILETNPYDEEYKETIKDEVMKYGCIAILLVSFVTFCIGVKSVFEMVFHD